MLSALLLISLFPLSSIAQSGRRRAPVPGVESAPPPPPPVTVPETTVVTSQEQVGDLSRFVLQNGMRVVINEMHAQPFATVVAYIRLTSLDAADLETARILEYALPLAGGAGPRGEIARQTAKLGGLPESSTGVDHTQFAITVPSTSVYDAIGIQAGMIQHAKFDADGVARAMKHAAIYNGEQCSDLAADSIARANRRLMAVAPDAVSAAAGDQANLVDRVAAFYTAHYRPENLIIAVAGDAPTFETLVQVERLYGQFGVNPGQGDAGSTTLQQPVTAVNTGQAQPPEPAPAATSQPALPGSEPRFSYEQRRGDVGQAIVTAAWRAPGYQSDDWPVAYLTSSLLGQGRGSLLSLSLLIDQGTVGRVESNYNAFEQSGALDIQLRLDPAVLDKAEAGLFKQTGELSAAGPRPEILALAKSRAELSFLSSSASCSGRAEMQSGLEASGQAVMLPADYVARIRAVTAEEVKLFAQKYLTMDSLSVDELLPASAQARTVDAAGFKQMILKSAPSLATTGTATIARGGTARSQPAKPAGEKPSATNGPQALNAEEQREVDSESIQPLPVKDFSTLNGPQAFVREEHSSPIVTIALLFQGGRVTEDETNSGITELMLRSIQYGTPRIAPAQMAADFDQLGADVEIVNKPEFFGLRMSVLSGNASAAMKLLRDIVEEPAFRDPDIDRARTEQITAIRSAKESAAGRAHELLLRAMFQGYAYGVSAHGVESSVAKLKPDQVREWYKQTVKIQYPLVSIAGDTEGSALVSEGVAGQFSRRDLSKSFQAKVPRSPSPSVQAESSHCQVSIATLGIPSPKAGSEDLPVLDVVAALLSSRGECFPDGTESLPGVAADVNVWVEPWLMSGAICMQVSSEAGDESRAANAFTQFAEKLASNGVAEAASQSARLVAAESYAYRLVNIRERAVEYARAVFTKHEASYVDSYAERLSKIRSIDVAKMLATYFKSGRVFVGVVHGSLGAAESHPAPKPVAPIN